MMLLHDIFKYMIFLCQNWNHEAPAWFVHNLLSGSALNYHM